MSLDSHAAKLSENVYNMLLLQVVPGKEISVVPQLSNSPSDDLEFYLGLGRYDVVALKKTSGISLFDEYQAKQVSDVTDCFPVCGIEWKTEEKKESPPIKSSPFLGISMVKLDPRETQNNKNGPIAAEIDLVASILSSMNIKVCCNLSNYELVFLLEAESIGELSDMLEKVKTNLVTAESPIALDITTIPSIRFEVDQDAIKLDEARLQEKISVAIFLALNIGINKTLHKLVFNAFDSCELDIQSIFGFHDAIVFAKGTLINILKGIKHLRDEHEAYGLHSTFTMLGHNGSVVRSCVYKPQYKYTKIAPYEKEQPSEDIYHFNQLINTCKHDFLTINLFRTHEDLLNYALGLVKHFQEERRNKNLSKYRDILEQYDSLTDILRQSFSQRFAGLAPGNLLAHKSLGLEPHGSIQRAILALESIPLFVFAKLSHKWSGLCTYGYAHRFYNSGAGLLNVPGEYRLSPDMWWGVFHELGHEARRYIAADVKGKVMKIVEEMAKRAYVTNSHQGLTRPLESYEGDYSVFADEVFAELFGFYHGFHGDWELYKQKVWRFFAREFPIDCEYLARSVLACLSLGPGENLRRHQITHDYLTQRFNELEHVAYEEFKVHIGIEEKEMARVIISQFLDISDIFAAYIKEQPKISNYNSKDASDLSLTLSAGSPVFVEDPMRVLFALMDWKNTFPIKMRVASILSLYNCYWRLLSQDPILKSNN